METSASKIKTIAEAYTTRLQWRNQKLKTVFTNGCFDVLHLGHVDYLEKARALGDRLILGLNTDASVQRLKGLERPLQNQLSRSHVVASLQFVDMVVLFDEDTPLELITQLVPDVLVKGSDYLSENIVGADIVKQHGGGVHTIDFVMGYSTTRILDKIKLTLTK